jgi:hypothetical protein
MNSVEISSRETFEHALNLVNRIFDRVASCSHSQSNTSRTNLLCKDIQSDTRQAGILVTGQMRSP